MYNFYVLHHLGLGDHISCNAIVRIITKKYSNYKINVFCKKKYFKLISFMYRDDNRIKAYPIKTKNNLDHEYFERAQYLIKKRKNGDKFLIIGFDNFEKIYQKNYKKSNPISYDMLFYKQLNINYNKRFKDCFWKRDTVEENRVYQKLVKKKKYAFVHDEPSKGYAIDSKFVSRDLEIIKNDNTENLFHMAKVIENAEEIHLMESSLRNMSESLNIKTRNLNLYTWRRRKVAPIYNYKLKKNIGTKKNWRIVYSNPKKKNYLFLLSNMYYKLRNYFFSYF